MPTPCFPEKRDQPDADALADALGRAYARWSELLDHVATTYPDVSTEWKHYGRTHGWQIKVSQKRRSLLYLVPHRKSFLAGMALRESALDSVRAARLPPDVVKAIEAGKTYQEGRPARVEVRTKQDVETVKTLLAIKAGTGS